MNDTIDISQLNSTLQDIQKAIQALLLDGHTKRVYSTSEAAAYLGMSEEWLKKARKTGSLSSCDDLPVFIKIGSSVKYLKTDLDNFLNGKPKFDHTAAASKKSTG